MNRNEYRTPWRRAARAAALHSQSKSQVKSDWSLYRKWILAGRLMCNSRSIDYVEQSLKSMKHSCTVSVC